MLKLPRQFVQPFNAGGVREQLRTRALDLTFRLGNFAELS